MKRLPTGKEPHRPRMTPGVRDQVERDYGRGFCRQQWLGLQRLFGAA